MATTSSSKKKASASFHEQMAGKVSRSLSDSELLRHYLPEGDNEKTLPEERQAYQTPSVEQLDVENHTHAPTARKSFIEQQPVGGDFIEQISDTKTYKEGLRLPELVARNDATPGILKRNISPRFEKCAGRCDDLASDIEEKYSEQGPSLNAKFAIAKITGDTVYGVVQNQFIIAENTDLPMLINTADTNTERFTKELERILNEASAKRTSPANQGLYKMNFHVSPKTIEVDFYKNEALLGSSKELELKSYFEEALPLTLNPFASPITINRMAVVGGAGYGKTEMLKKFTQHVVSGKIPNLQDVCVVHYLHFCDLPVEKKITPGELLFGETELSEKGRINQTMDWILANQKKFILVLDGADQYSDENNVLGKGKSAGNHKQKSHSTAILNGILAGKLFPDVRVLFSSREYMLRHFEDAARPDRVVALVGFDLKNIKNLIQATEKGESIWRYLETKCPFLLPICSIPMFLDFTVSVLLRHMGKPPETLTELLMHVLKDWMTSDHIQGPDELCEVMHKLKSMCFQGALVGKITYTKQDLPTGMTEDQYKDIIIPEVGSKGRNRKLSEGHFQFRFVHESLQEALTALHIAEMSQSDFENIVFEKLNTPQWVIVRRLLCGLLLNKSCLAVAKGNDPSVSLIQCNVGCEKVDNLRQNLLQQVETQNHQSSNSRAGQLDFLELLHAVNECGDVSIASSLHYLDLSRLNLTDSDLQAIATVVRRCLRLDTLSLPSLGAARVPNFINAIAGARIGKVTYGLNSVLYIDEVLAICQLSPEIADELFLIYVASGQQINDIIHTMPWVSGKRLKLKLYRRKVLDQRRSVSERYNEYLIPPARRKNLIEVDI